MKRIRSLAPILLVLLMACGGDPDPAGSPPSGPTTTTPSETPSETPSPTTQPLPAPGGSPASSPATCGTVSGGSDGTNVKLVEVRVGTHDGYDRIVFEFAPPQPPSPADTLPKFTITEVAEVTQDGSGNPVQVNGEALYSLVMHGASGVDLSGSEVVPTYTGPREFKPGFPVLVELEHAGDFENVLSWGIGLKTPRCIEATKFSTPLRLVLDIPHS